MKADIVCLILVCTLTTVLSQVRGATVVQPSVPTSAFAVEFDKLKAEMAELRRVSTLPQVNATAQKEQNYNSPEKTVTSPSAAVSLMTRAVALARSQPPGSNSLAVLLWVLSGRPEARRSRRQWNC